MQTLKQAFMPDDGSTTMTFASEDDVLNYLGTKVQSTLADNGAGFACQDSLRCAHHSMPQVLLPIWKDPVCGDGNCEYPCEAGGAAAQAWLQGPHNQRAADTCACLRYHAGEFPAWGDFGCQAGTAALHSWQALRC